MSENTFTVTEEPTVVLAGICSFEKPAKKVGRPKKKINWPEGKFTFEDVLKSNENLSKSSIRNNVIKKIKDKTLVKSGKIKTPFGRPKDLYQEV